MGKTVIEWTATRAADGTMLPGYSFNAWHGCQHVHEGCRFCWAENNAKRFGFAKWGPTGTRNKTSAEYWRQPLKWNKAAEKAGVRRKVFCNSSSDVFEDWQGWILDHKGHRAIVCDGCGKFYEEDFLDANAAHFICECGRLGQRMAEATMDDLRAALFALIDATPFLDWQLLTKRPENIRRMWAPFVSEVQPKEHHRHNVWLGTSISDQPTAEKYANALTCGDLAPILFWSIEPLLGPIDLAPVWRNSRLPDWVIIGGESGPGARPCNVEWVRSLRDQCQAAGVPVFIKQLGSDPWLEPGELDRRRAEPGYIPLTDPKGGDPDQWPADLRVRDFPAEATHA